MAVEKTAAELEEELADAIAAEAEAAGGDDPVIDEAFITDSGEVISENDAVKSILRGTMRCFDSERIHREAENSPLLDVSKSVVSGSTQSDREMNESEIQATSLANIKVVEPPYPPEVLSVFLEIDETHFRCVKTKTTDAIGRDYELKPHVPVVAEPQADEGDETPAFKPGKNPILEDYGDGKSAAKPEGKPDKDKPENEPENGKPKKEGEATPFKPPVDKTKPRTPGEDLAKRSDTPKMPESEKRNAVKQSVIDDEVDRIKQFIDECNEIIGFEGVLERAGMDYEAIGWAAIEVIRSRDGQIRKLAHVPAERIRVLRGWKGFVEIVSPTKFVYYQNLGEKVVSKSRKDPLTKKAEKYNPREDGELNMSKLDWSMIDRETGEPTSNFNKSANEIIWIPKHHSKTIYYGIGDVTPALGYVLANVHIRDYQLQFFEHNTVPRYAVVIEGAKLSESVKKLIQEYFGTHVKGKAHKTLIVPIPALRGEVKLRFEKLDADSKESSFIESRKANAQGIMTAHGVSPAIIGIAESSELGSGKGLSQAEIYKDRIVSPSQKKWGHWLNRLFKLGLGVQSVSLKFSPLDIRDRKAEQEMYDGYLERGAITINEVRKAAGLGDAITGGDRAFIQIQGQGIQFVDELTDAMSSEREALAQEIETTKQELANKANEEAARQKGMAEGMKQAPPGQPPGKPGAPPNAGSKPKPFGGGR